MSDERTPRDGRPFYCVKCRCGFGEFMACEMSDCELESEESAEIRALLVKSNPGSKPKHKRAKP